MIDIHSHILPNIDDGSKSIEETYNLLKEAKEVGFEGVILTPHYIEGYYERNQEELMRKVKENIQDINIEIYIGNEVYLSENIIKNLKSKKIYSINNSRYILFEMPINVKPLSMYEVIYELLQYKLIPILAHPERYMFVFKEPELIYDLIQKGVLMQANYGSIVGQYGQRTKFIVKKFLENNMIHFLGTDVHRENTIYPNLPMILEKLNKLIGEEKVRQLSEVNPRLVLNNEKIVIEEPNILKFRFDEKLILNKW